MARIYLIDSSMKLCYTVEQAVGTGCPNRRDDVLLVQFLLKIISEGPEKTKYTPPGKGPLKCDGLWGPTSQAYLNRYIVANTNANPNAPLTKDGRVDPVVGGKFTGAISGNLYTILALNNSYKNVRGAAAMQDLTTEPQFPGELRPSLKVA